MSAKPRFVRTTILAVRRGDQVAVAGDGQVTLDRGIMKNSARKVRRVAGGSVLVFIWLEFWVIASSISPRKLRGT